MWDLIHREYGSTGYGPAIIFYFVCIVILFGFGKFVAIPAIESMVEHHAAAVILSIVTQRGLSAGEVKASDLASVSAQLIRQTNIVASSFTPAPLRPPSDRRSLGGLAVMSDMR